MKIKQTKNIYIRRHFVLSQSMYLRSISYYVYCRSVYPIEIFSWAKVLYEYENCPKKSFLRDGGGGGNHVKKM
jgi:hypothetical protein